MNKESIKMFFRILFNPSCWKRLYPYSKEWDKKLNDFLDTNPKILNLDKYSVHFEGDVFIWIANFPYAYGNELNFEISKFNNSGMNNNKKILFTLIKRPTVIPSRKTVFRLYDYIKTYNFKFYSAEEGYSFGNEMIKSGKMSIVELEEYMKSFNEEYQEGIKRAIYEAMIRKS